MASIRILHAADFHAGRPAPAYLGEEKGRLRREELVKALQTTVDVAKSESVHLLLISGDLFEHAYSRVGMIREMLALFERIPDTRVFITPGNHDPYVDGSFYATLKMPDNVHVFKERAITRVILDDPGVVVHGLGWTKFEETARLLSGYRCTDGEYANVLMIHGDFVTDSTGSSYLPILPEDIRGSGADYVALGHIHVRTEFQCGTTTCVYPGSPEPLDFGEEGEHGVYLVELCKGSVKTKFVPTARRKMHRVSCDITGADTLEKVRAAILSVGEPSERKSGIWEVTLTGVADPEIELDLDDIKRAVSDEFFYVKIVLDVVPDYDLEAIASSNAQGLESRFVRAIMEKREQARAAGDEVRVRILEKALYFGLDAMKLKRIVRRGIVRESE
ncbi:MAG TPA: DNA repair exonuclease [Firmicutes bacterium]|nr:DNA repair exonuclease [Candidatus Fermentithermobacillaceae bacterium]